MALTDEKKQKEKAVKTMSMTEFRTTPARDLFRIMAKEDIKLTKYGKGVAVIRPLRKELQGLTMREFMQRIAEWRKKYGLSEDFFSGGGGQELARKHGRKSWLQDASVPKAERKKEGTPDWWAGIREEERRLEERKWERIFPQEKGKKKASDKRAKGRIIDAAHEMARDLKRTGVKDVSTKHDEYIAEDLAKRKTSPKSKPVRSGLKRTSGPKRTR